MAQNFTRIHLAIFDSFGIRTLHSGLMLTSAPGGSCRRIDGHIVRLIFSFWIFFPRARGKLLGTLEVVGCSCHVHLCYVGPLFWINAHIVHVVHFGSGLDFFSVGARSAAGHLGDGRMLLPCAFLLCGTFIFD